MKFLGKVLDPKHVTTKEYVDNLAKDLDDKKVSTEDIAELTEEEVQDIWDSVFVSKGASS